MDFDFAADPASLKTSIQEAEKGDSEIKKMADHVMVCTRDGDHRDRPFRALIRAVRVFSLRPTSVEYIEQIRAIIKQMIDVSESELHDFLSQTIYI